MAKTQTSHEPSAEELADAHDGGGEAHGPDDHGETHGHDDHAHGEGEALGPWDVQRWGALALGIGAGLLVVACLVVSMSLSPAAG